MNADLLARLQVAATTVPTISQLFETSPQRGHDFRREHDGILFDFSRQRISHEMLQLLWELTIDSDIPSRLAAMFAGEKINVTEHRAVLHTALRDHGTATPEAMRAYEYLNKARDLAHRIRADESVHTVVNIGIGGSDLGPAMATRALRQFHDGPDVRFVSNVDAADLDSALEGLLPQHTVFVVSSKTFTTSETIHNAERARTWMSQGGVSWNERFYAATAHPAVAQSWGIRPENCLQFEEWVGGRFSLASVIGFPLMCAIGSDAFDDFLSGMHSMDLHARNEDPHDNLAIIHALVWFANASLHKFPTVAVVPYSHDLSLLPAYLQQLVMESNGKGVTVNGEDVELLTSPVVWGQSGTNGQHAFFQMLHQGTQVVPVEFIGSATALGSDQEAHDILIANMVAQAEALAVGDDGADSHRYFPGNKPNSVIMVQELSPYSLGQLVALYEHSTAIQGWLLGVNSFDQFGVELGKTIAQKILSSLRNETTHDNLTVTHPLLEWYQKQRRTFS